jgi:hypothetical protein
MQIRSGIITLIGALAACASLQASNIVYLSSSTPSGFTAGPYSGTLNGIGIELFCDDAVDNAPIGGSWTVDVTSIAGATSNTRFGEQTTNVAGATLPTGTALYEELAWLYTQLANTTPNSSYALGVQTAAWDLTSTDDPNDGADAKIWMAAAQADYNKTSGIPAVTVDSTIVTIVDPTYSNWMILTPPAGINDPTGGSGNQEFLSYYDSTGSGGHSPTPEPATFGLAGVGLLAGGLFGRRRRRAK